MRKIMSDIIGYQSLQMLNRGLYINKICLIGL